MPRRRGMSARYLPSRAEVADVRRSAAPESRPQDSARRRAALRRVSTGVRRLRRRTSGVAPPHAITATPPAFRAHHGERDASPHLQLVATTRGDSTPSSHRLRLRDLSCCCIERREILGACREVNVRPSPRIRSTEDYSAQTAKMSAQAGESQGCEDSHPGRLFARFSATRVAPRGSTREDRRVAPSYVGTFHARRRRPSGMAAQRAREAGIERGQSRVARGRRRLERE
jgi:hypothetical protein